jgi:formate/nitrite transporter FocA (FNT family)
MLLGAQVTLTDWWIWNQIPVTLGNLIGGMVCTGLAIYFTHRPAAPVHAPRLDPLVTDAPEAMKYSAF